MWHAEGVSEHVLDAEVHLLKSTSMNLVSQAHHCPLANVEIALLYASANVLLYGCIHLRPDALRPFN